MDLNFDEGTEEFRAEVREFLAANRDAFPTESYDTREGYEGRVVWLPEADQVWQKVIDDEPLSRRLGSKAINAGEVPGSGDRSPSPDAEEERAEREAAGLCA